MSYVDDNLGREETVLYRAKMSWGVFLPAMILAAIGVLAISSGAAAFFFAIAILLAIYAQLRRATTELALTNKRVVAKFGLIRRVTLAQRLEMVDNIQVVQGIVQRLCGAGSVGITGSGAAHTPVPFISEPLRFRRAVDEAIDELKKRATGATAPQP